MCVINNKLEGQQRKFISKNIILSNDENSKNQLLS